MIDDDFAKTLHNSLPITDEVCAAIGGIVVSSASLERCIEQLIGFLTKLSDEEVRIMLGNAMFGGKLAVLEGLGAAKLSKRPKKLTEFTNLIVKIKAENTSRTIATHGHWESGWEGSLDRLMAGTAPPFDPSKYRAKRTRSEGNEARLGIKEARALSVKIGESHTALLYFFVKAWPRQVSARSTILLTPVARKSTR